MRKLTKKALSLMLCLLLVASAISGALSISAETVVNDAPLNIDFSDGTNHWTNAKIEVNNGAAVLADNSDNWSLTSTEEFGFVDLEAGERVTIYYRVTVIDPEAVATAKYTSTFRTNFSTSADSWANHYDDFHASINKLNEGGEITTPGTGLFTNHTSGELLSKSFTVTDPAQTFKFGFARGNSPAGAISVSDIKVTVDKNNGTQEIYTGAATPYVPSIYNFDFADGLFSWENTDNVDVTNGVMTFTTGRANWTYLQTRKHSFDNLEVGDQVAFVMNVKPTELAASDSGERIRTYFDTYNPDGSTIKEEIHSFNSRPNGQVYETKLTVTDPDQSFRIRIAKANGTPGGYEFTNIHMVKVLPGGGYLDLTNGEQLCGDLQPDGGTEEKGIVAGPFEGSYVNWGLSEGDKRIKAQIGATTNLLNGDFSKGFKYWMVNSNGTEAQRDICPADVATVDKETGIVQLSTAAANNGYNPYLYTMPFYIEGISAGDVLSVAVDARNAFNKDGSHGIQLTLWELKDHSSSKYYYSTQTTANSSFFTAASDTDWTTIYNNVNLTVTDPSHPFMLRLAKHADDAAEFKNVRIYKINPSTGEVALVNFGYDDDANLNKDGGSEENGMMELGNYVQATPAVDKLTNLDFSQGLKYWALKTGSRGFASDVAEVQLDGSLTITVISSDIDGIETAPIIFGDDWAGKEVTLWFHSNTAKVIERSYYADGVRNAAQANGGIGWYGITIPSVSAGVKYNFELKIPGGKAGDSVNVSGLKLLTPVLHNNNIRSYVDLDGNEFFGSGLDFQPYGGTEDGIILPSNGAGIVDGSYWNNTRNNMPTNDEGFLNGDFSEGFKYWSSKKIGDLPAEQFLLNEGLVTFNPSYDFTGKTYAGLYSQTFTVGNYGLNVGDKFFVEADVTNTPNGSMAIKLASVYYDENEAGGVANYHLNNGTSAGSGKVAEGSWVTMRTSATVKEINEQFTVSIEKQYEGGGGSFKNVRLSKLDKGGMKKFNATSGELEDVEIRINIDGSLQANQLLGDANNDGKIDITDIVRMKKEAAGMNDLGIFFAAVDIDANGTIGAADLAEVIAKVVDPAYDLEIIE